MRSTSHDVRCQSAADTNIARNCFGYVDLELCLTMTKLVTRAPKQANHGKPFVTFIQAVKRSDLPHPRSRFSRDSFAGNRENWCWKVLSREVSRGILCCQRRCDRTRITGYTSIDDNLALIRILRLLYYKRACLPGARLQWAIFIVVSRLKNSRVHRISLRSRNFRHMIQIYDQVTACLFAGNCAVGMPILSRIIFTNSANKYVVILNVSLSCVVHLSCTGRRGVFMQNLTSLGRVSMEKLKTLDGIP
jgi:hypothetical protein